VKLAEAIIAWTPARAPNTRAGQVQIGRLVPKDQHEWTALYTHTGGAANRAVRQLSGSEAVARTFIEFHTLVMRDGIDPRTAHEAFLVIDEYAMHISPDISGARGMLNEDT
jgi:hypothetical protein